MSVQAMTATAASALATRASVQAFQGAAAQSTAAQQVDSAPPATGTSQSQQPSMDEITKALSDVQAVIQPVARDLLFSIDNDTGKTVVKVVDSVTDKVIRQIPSEELIAIAKALDKFQGLLLKQEA